MKAKIEELHTLSIFYLAQTYTKLGIANILNFDKL